MYFIILVFLIKLFTLYNVCLRSLIYVTCALSGIVTTVKFSPKCAQQFSA